jgi:hypothetical protein
VRALAHGGRAVLLTSLLAALDLGEQSDILASPYAVYDLMTCGAALETTALVSRFSPLQRARVLCADGAVAAFASHHRDSVWRWLGELPSSAHAPILSVKGAIAALVVDRDSASMVARLIEALGTSAQLSVLSRTDALRCLVHHGQSRRVLGLLAARTGAELASLLPECGAMQRLVAEGHGRELTELVSAITPAERARILADREGLQAFLQDGRRSLVTHWLLVLDVEAQSRLLGSPTTC